MEKKYQGTKRSAPIPKHITSIGMSTEQYYELKVFIKLTVLPGTPCYDMRLSKGKEGRESSRKWLDSALGEIGPRLFPRGGKGLVWPENYTEIYGAVYTVIRSLSANIRKDYKKKEDLKVTKETLSDDGKELLQHTADPEPRGSASTDFEEDLMIIDEEVQMQNNSRMRVRLEEHSDELTNAAELELEDLLDLMKPEAFAQFPGLADEGFDWDDVDDPYTVDALRYLANLDQ
ncbi:hypothetical protein L873DRAFT_1791961 [Choiromyces venosus 120613-1]|uniref:Uncharacterized protein n=1 Tax=Choiromyces venosus 120613-1 TaxID=1336337 RepID=A0A3N4JEZ4_9PEZI|nr:hypothetical protein L873DRAFT_1791961 [Choiromyces venosus 120613-1]